MNHASTKASAANPTGRVLVVDDHREARESTAEVLRQFGHHVECCSSAAEALQQIAHAAYDCILTDLNMPGMNGVEFIIQLGQRRYPAQVVMVTAYASVATAVEAMRHGAFDYIEKPFGIDQIEQLIAQAIRHGRMRNPPLAEAAKSEAEPAMIGTSLPMRLLRERIAQIAPTPVTVLITGESGTGKEMVARAIHAQSDRKAKPLVSLNCPVLSAHLMESELFGHERGAFTGADGPRTGRFEMADGGTILLDEVTEIDLNLQAKLLRVLQERSFERVGSSRTLQVDVRVLATTNRDLQREVASHRFREDLYFRLAVLPLVVPPLRERREDIGELLEYFFARYALRLGREPCRVEPSALELLMEYHWPGNVRELENIATRASVLNIGKPITADELRRWLLASPDSATQVAATPIQASQEARAIKAIHKEQQSELDCETSLSLQEMERRMIEATLERFGGHRAKTAQALGIGLRTLTGKLRQYGYAPREKTYSKAG